MSTGKTKYLGLHRWEPEDNFLRTEFNENSDKLDGELEAQHREMEIELALVRGELADGLEAASRKNEMEFSLMRGELTEGLSNHSHDAGDITSGTLPISRGGTGQSTLSGLAAALKGAGAMRYQVVSYAGTGAYGEANPTSMTFAFAPVFVLYMGKRRVSNPGGISLGSTANDYFNLYLPEWPTTYTQNYGISLGGRNSTSYGKKSEDGKTISWYNTQENAQLNDASMKYYFIAFG